MKKKVFASDFDGTLYFYQADVKLKPDAPYDREGCFSGSALQSGAYG